jgi:hypothetical protein
LPCAYELGLPPDMGIKIRHSAVTLKAVYNHH